MQDHYRPDRPPLGLERHGEDLQGCAGRLQKLPPALSRLEGAGDRRGSHGQPGRHPRRDRYRSALGVIDRHARDARVASKLIGQSLQVRPVAALEHLGDRLSLAFGQQQHLPVDLGLHCVHLRCRLINGENRGNGRHTTQQGEYQPAAQAHSIPPVHAAPRKDKKGITKDMSNAVAIGNAGKVTALAVAD